jgi:MoxR-like ATPase
MRNDFSSTNDYVASEELMASVNVAIALQKPLLIKGEPGTGKTMLAKAVANSLGKELIIWNIKSTTKAQDGLYMYDTIQRLYDGQFGEEGVDDIAHYIKLGKLGEAFKSEEQVVLLIDEIDKADLEFPNDLLWELDQMEFYIHETKETVKAKQRPIVIITSNAEKELPDAFLRRCIFHFIEFPGKELMEEIVKTHYPDVEQNLLNAAMDVFYEIRGMREVRKKPSTSELIDWINALQLGGIPFETIKKNLPFIGVVVKKDECNKASEHHDSVLSYEMIKYF